MIQMDHFGDVIWNVAVAGESRISEVGQSRVAIPGTSIIHNELVISASEKGEEERG
jgi:hypothetical protein